MDKPKQTYIATIRQSVYFTVEVEATTEAEANILALEHFDESGGKQIDIDVDVETVYSEEDLKKMKERG